MTIDNLQPILYVSRIIILIIAISFHEFAHAFAADWLGDPTPRSEDRLTIDPRKHLDTFGSIMFLIAGFGWGKPVYTNPRNYHIDYRTGIAIVAASGPLANFILAYIASIIYQFASINYEIVAYFLSMFIKLNLLLMLFNLLPIAPLDGYQITIGILPHAIARQIAQFQNQGPIILILIIATGSIFQLNLFGIILGPPYQLLINLLMN